MGYHLLNLLLHAGVTWLLYLLLQAILGSSAQQKTTAFVAAMLFAVHPTHTEAVASVVGRAELLAAGFLLAGWILHLRDLEIPALRINPDFPDPLALYGLLEFHQGNYQMGGAMMEKALHMTGRDNLNYDYLAVNFAMVLMQTNHADGALELLNREVAESPEYAPAWSTRALIHYKSGEIAPARADAQAALRLNPGDTQALEVMNLLAAATPAGTPR